MGLEPKITKRFKRLFRKGYGAYNDIQKEVQFKV
jgi:hypothetical protein